MSDCNIFKALWIAIIASAPVWYGILSVFGAFK